MTANIGMCPKDNQSNQSTLTSNSSIDEKNLHTCQEMSFQSKQVTELYLFCHKSEYFPPRNESG